MPDPRDLVGLFVVEVGERQAWPFVQFCDNSPTPHREVRLYIDTHFDVHQKTALAPGQPLAALLGLNNLTVTDVAMDDDGLRVTFDDESTLAVAATSQATTVGDVWWLSPWL